MNEEKREETMQSTDSKIARPKLNIKDLLLSLAAILVSACILSGAIPSAFVGLASLALFVYAVIAIRNAGAIIQLVLSALIATVLTFLPICGAAVLALAVQLGLEAQHFFLGFENGLLLFLVRLALCVFEQVFGIFFGTADLLFLHAFAVAVTAQHARKTQHDADQHSIIPG